jgi:hypothetical protein
MRSHGVYGLYHVPAAVDADVDFSLGPRTGAVLVHHGVTVAGQDGQAPKAQEGVGAATELAEDLSIGILKAASGRGK